MLVILWFSTTLMAGCGKQTNDLQNNSNKQSSTYVDKDCDGDYQIFQDRKSCLRVALSQAVGTIDPGLIFNTNQAEIVEQLFLGLTDFQKQENGSYKVVGELALDWQITKEGTVYTFNLRRDISWVKCEKMETEKCIKWSQVRPVTAHDIVWTIRRNLVKNGNAPLWHIKNYNTIHEHLQNETQQEYFLQTGNIFIENKILSFGVRAINNYTIEFILEQAYGAFPALVSVAAYHPLPRHVIEKYGDKWTELKNIQMSGSYMLSDWQKGNDIILEKNPYYYDDVQISKVHYYIIPEIELGLTMYKNNALDILGGSYLELPMTDIYYIKTDPHLADDVKIGSKTCTIWYGINTQRPPTDNLLVRKALAAALDKQLLIDAIIKENKPAKTLIHPISVDSVNPKEKMGISFDPKQANRWLEEYKNVHPHQELPKIILAHSRHEDISKITQGVKILLTHYLKDIDIEVKEVDFDAYWNEVEPLKPETTPHLFWENICPDYPNADNWLNRFHSQQGLNWLSGDNSKRFDKIMDEATQIDNHNERKEKYRQAEQILIQEEVAVIPLYFNYPNILVKPRIKGWYNMPMGGQHIRNWTLKSEEE